MCILKPRSSMDFSIIIPSFRDPRILETIDSINKQTYRRDKLEIVVMDGGSDKLLLIEIRNHLQPHDLLFSEKDDGIFDAINRGIARASGEVIFTLGSDDKFASSDAVGDLMGAFANPEVQYVCAGIGYTNKRWEMVRDWPATQPTLTNFLLGCQVSHFGFACRKRVYDEIGYFTLSYDYSADFDFFLRLSKRKLIGARVSKRLVFMKLGGKTSKNVRNILRGNKQIFASGYSHYGPLILVHLMAKPFVKALQFVRAL